MKYLLDTHIILWALIGDERIPKDVKDILYDPLNDIYYSSASSWEIEIKHLSKENFKLSAEQFAFLCDKNGLINIPIRNSDINKLKQIRKVGSERHNDPFDRLLLAQAISENMIFITHDKKFNLYSNPNIMLI